MQMKLTELINQAILSRSLVELYYDGGTRLVEPHCLGITTAGNYALRAYQIRGYSKSGERMGWKLFDLSKASNVQVLAEKFEGPRHGYQRGDKAMAVIYMEL
jgi:predicted DNA-binding transcriptional regulator YafY